MEYIQLTWFGKTCPEHFPVIEVPTFTQSSKHFAESKKKYQFLDLRNGDSQAKFWDMDGQSHGGHWMHNTGECPNVDVESSLSQIIEGGGAGKILFESEGVSGYSHESFQAWQSSSRITENYTGEAIGVENHSQDSRYKLTGDITESLSTKMGTGGNNVPLVAFRESGILNFKEDGCSGTIRAQGGNWGHYDSIQRTDQYKESRIASTVAARDYKSSTDLIVERK